MYTKKVLVMLTVCLLTIGNSFAFISQPYLLSPTSGVQLKSFEVNVQVNSVSQATGYQFQFDSVATFTSSYFSSITIATAYTYTPSFRKALKVYWRARAYKSGDTSAWSDTYNFTTGIKMTNNSPATNTTGTIRSLNAYPVSTMSPATYIFKVDTSPLFNSPLFIYRAQSSVWFIDTPLFQFGRKLYWSCTAVNIDGDTLDWSDPTNYTFYTQPTLNVLSSSIHPRTIVSWPTTNSASVELQVDTAADFSSFRLQTKFINPVYTQDTIWNLLFDKRYYFRMRAKFGESVSAWSAVRNALVFGYGAVTTPSNGGLSTLTPTISWSARTGAVAQFQLFADSALTQLLIDTMTSTSNYTPTFYLKLNTKYYTRLRYMHALDTTAWGTTWFKTTPGQINLGAPASNAQNQDVRLRFSVRKDVWATKAVIEIDSGSVFTANRTRFFISADSLKYDGSYYHYIDTSVGYGGTYVWRAYQLMGTDTAQPSAARIFTTKSTPSLYYPPNQMIGVGTQTNGLITGINGSAWVQWQLDTSLTFASPELAEGIDAHVPDDFTPQYVNLNFPGERLFKQTYYWRARCLNRVDTSKWSTPFSFSTTTDMWLQTPANNATGVSIRPYLSWSIQGSVTDYGYQYQLSSDTLFTSPFTKTLIGSDVAGDTAICTFATKYYWRARAFHSRDTSGWSPYWAFTTVGKPVISAPILVSPAMGQLNIPLTQLTLYWNAAANASSYDVEVATDDQFTGIVASGNTPATGVYFSGQQPGSKYWWRVRGRLDTLIGPWSSVRWFQTVPPVGLNEWITDEGCTIYPNPANQFVNIQTSQASQMRVYNSLGKLIWSDDHILLECKLEVTSWSAGIYFVHLITAQGTVVKKVEVIKE